MSLKICFMKWTGIEARGVSVHTIKGLRFVDVIMTNAFRKILFKRFFKPLENYVN